jgi:hypothetical protein
MLIPLSYLLREHDDPPAEIICAGWLKPELQQLQAICDPA